MFEYLLIFLELFGISLLLLAAFLYFRKPWILLILNLWVFVIPLFISNPIPTYDAVFAGCETGPCLDSKDIFNKLGLNFGILLIIFDLIYLFMMKNTKLRTYLISSVNLLLLIGIILLEDGATTGNATCAMLQVPLYPLMIIFLIVFFINLFLLYTNKKNPKTKKALSSPRNTKKK